jgi:GTPase SAR1 family protein
MNIEINLAVVGDSKSGKSSLVDCFLSQQVEDQYSETIINITRGEIKIDNEYIVNINF